MINDFFAMIFAFAIYWLVGWGLLIAGIVFFIYLIRKAMRPTTYRGKLEKGFMIAGFIIYVAVIGFLFWNITHYAKDLDPNRQTEQSKSIERQLD